MTSRKRRNLNPVRASALECARYVFQFVPDQMTWERARDTVAHEVKKNFPELKPRTLTTIANAASRLACAE